MSTVKFITPLRAPPNRRGLIVTNVAVLTTQFRIFIFIVITILLTVASIYYDVIPDYLMVGLPIAVTIGCCVWGWTSARAGHPAMSDRRANNLLEIAVILAPAATAIILFWSPTLFNFGAAYTREHILLCLCVTIVIFTFGQMHLRPAAPLMTAVFVVPFTIFFLTAGRPVFIAIALDMVLVSAAMIYILLVSARDFARMKAFQKQLLEAHGAEVSAQRDALKHAARFEVALNSMLHGLCMFDSDDRLIVCNRRYIQMYSLPPALTRPGANWRDLVAYRMERLGHRDLNQDDVLTQRRDVDLRYDLYSPSADRGRWLGRHPRGHYREAQSGGTPFAYDQS